MRARLRHLGERAARPATSTVNGVRVRRFPGGASARPDDFGRRSQRVFEQPHSLHDELAWLDSEGPASPALIRHITRAAPTFDFFVFFSYRYYHAWHGARAVPGKAVLVPTAERDPAIGLSIFAPVFRGVRALMYNSLEERALIAGTSAARERCPAWSSASGRRFPTARSPGGSGRSSTCRRPFALYVGRIDENKGCAELFSLLRALRGDVPARPRPGARSARTSCRCPKHPRIRHLGFLPTRTSSTRWPPPTCPIMPSHFESLSMVALEAWALGKPVLANGQCDVLRGQCDPQQRGPVLREVRGVRRGAVRARGAPARSAAVSAATAASSSGGTTPGRSSSGSTSTCSSG